MIDVLIISSLYDLSTDLICHQLLSAGASFARINRETLHQSRLHLDPLRPYFEYTVDNRTWTADADLRSIYYRQPVFLRNTPDTVLTIEEQLDRSQWLAFLRSLTVFENARWVNHPQATYLAESKPYQLRRASYLGFRIPETIITNDVTRLMHPRLGDPFILKSIDTVLLRDGGDELFAYSSITKVDECSVENFSPVPSTCQAFLPSKLDLRITVIGKKAYCVAITACGRKITGDWRLTGREALEYTEYKLPIRELERCRALVSNLGLEFGAIDLAESLGELFFLEINPTGEWGWLTSIERPIAADIAQLLLKDR